MCTNLAHLLTPRLQRSVFVTRAGSGGHLDSRPFRFLSRRLHSYPTPGISGVPPQRPGPSSGRSVKLGGGVAGDLAGSTSKASSQVGRHAKVRTYCCTCTMQGWRVSAVHASDFKLYLLYACFYLSAFLIRVRVALTVRACGSFQLQRGAARYHRTAP